VDVEHITEGLVEISGAPKGTPMSIRPIKYKSPKDIVKNVNKELDKISTSMNVDIDPITEKDFKKIKKIRRGANEIYNIFE